MEAMVRGGVAQQSDADAIKAELLMARQQQTELEAMRSVQSQVLTILCGQEINSVVMPTDIQIAEGSRPELRLLDSQTLLLTAQEKQQDASLHPRLSLFAKAYYGYMGYNLFHDMMEAEPTFNSTIGARLTWNFASIYTRSDKRRKMSLQRESIETQRSLFLFNQKMTLTEESRRESKFTQLMAEDDEIIALRTSIRKAEEAKLTAGTIDVNNLISVITRESAAIISKSIHEIELTKARYEQSLTRGE